MSNVKISSTSATPTLSPTSDLLLVAPQQAAISLDLLGAAEEGPGVTAFVIEDEEGSDSHLNLPSADHSVQNFDHGVAGIPDPNNQFLQFPNQTIPQMAQSIGSVNDIASQNELTSSSAASSQGSVSVVPSQNNSPVSAATFSGFGVPNFHVDKEDGSQ